ncbi:MAG TPA: hypothetical protein VFZ09_27565 [Archangium sp.]|uniref:hypothetical protein n=1 Tax=Archangium sp. TaxID=1872627 RepID=UPI002E375A20|nr:hypothetical protein [Archangium sp.]HEX5750019.1 hypothetical protein [Archangium sp.]
MPTPYDFTTLARAATRIRVSTSDAELPALITAASRALANFLGYEAHLREEVDETVVGQGGVYVWLRAGQVRQLHSVKVHGAELAEGEVAIDCPRAGRLVRRRGRWPFTGSSTAGIVPIPLQAHDSGDIVVSFDSGWRTPGQVALALEAEPSSTLTSELPPELEEAALLVLTAWYRRLGQDPDVTTKSLGDASISWGADSMRGGKVAIPLIAAQLAAHHRKPGRGST